MTVRFVNPVADCLVAPNHYDLRVDLGQSVSVGLVINKIVDCDMFMRCVGEELLALRPNIEIIPYQTGEITFASAELIDQIADECNAAVCAIGHCGSCTAGTVKDGVALVERGIPAVSLVTELFWDQGEALARSLGWSETPRVKLPYPIWGTGTGSMRDVASLIAPSIVKIFEQPQHA